MKSPTDWIHQIAHGDLRALAKALRAVDDQSPLSRPLLESAAARTLSTSSHVIGFTGSPGAGKSSVVDALITHYRAAGLRVAVIAVDPSSPFTGGAILGDRIRMQRHTLDSGVFVRSLATRGALGGLSKSVADSILLLKTAGFDMILLETVGVGQGEVDVCRIAQSVVVILTPGAGDDIQAIKAGILEIADVYLVNKADREGADKVAGHLNTMLSLVPHAAPPPILKSVATSGLGIADLASALKAHLDFLTHSEAGRQREQRRLQGAFIQQLQDAILMRCQSLYSTEIARATEQSRDLPNAYFLVEALVSAMVSKP